jgi:hypothetical protein
MITLKSIKIFDDMHDDSNAFHATICWNGKKVGTCSDNGQAGIIDFDVPNNILDEMSKYAAAQPEVECQGHKLSMTLDLLVGEIVANEMRSKEEKRTQKWLEKNKKMFATHNCETIALYYGVHVACIPFRPVVMTAEKAVEEWKQKNPQSTVKKWSVV